MSSNQNTNQSQESAHSIRRAAAVNNVITLAPRGLDCSGGVDGTVDIIEHAFDTTVISILPRLAGVRFDTVHHPKDLATLMEHLHPRLAATSEPTIARLNQRLAGSIRGWHQFAKHIDGLPSTRENPKAALTKEEVHEMQNVLGMA